METAAGRYAIYYAPAPASALADFGRSWLGYDAETGSNVEQPAAPGIAAPRLAEVTAELARWGYPYVMDEFRFHLTLTGRLAPDEASRVGAIIAERVAPLCRAALPIDAVALFHQPGSGENFRLVGRYRLAGREDAGSG